MADRFSALSGCADQLVASPRDPIAVENGAVRIDGVSAEPLKKRERETARQIERSLRTPVPVPGPVPGAVSVAAPAISAAYGRDIARAAAVHKIDPLFLHAVIDAESGYRPHIVSPAGAVGLMQIMPATGAGLGVDRSGLFDPARNIDAGARHLKTLQRRFGKDLNLILSAYNAGEGAVARYGNRTPPFRETRDYVVKVMGRYQQLRYGFGSAK